MIVTKDKIVNGLRKLGLGSGDLVTLHSSLKSLGHVEGGAQAVIRALLETIGPEGTILMPAFSFPLKSEEEPIFDVRETPSCVGLITEVFRREYATHRSIHLSHSYSAAGRLAAELTVHPLDITPCGEDSPIGKFLRRDGKILLLGVGYNACTAFHAVEERLKAPYMTFQEHPRSEIPHQRGIVSFAVQNTQEDVFIRFHHHGERVSGSRRLSSWENRRGDRHHALRRKFPGVRGTPTQEPSRLLFQRF